jgi:hypothetical protein
MKLIMYVLNLTYYNTRTYRTVFLDNMLCCHNHDSFGGHINMIYINDIT